MPEQKKTKITFHNKITPHYREIHVDGAHGGITPKGLVQLSFFSERFPIPKSTDFKILSNGQIGERIKDSSDSKSGVIREFEIGVYMDVNTTKQVIKLLNDKIQEFEKLLKQSKNANNSTRK